MADYKKPVMSEKEFDRFIRDWFIFGERLDGKVDISNSSGDVLCGVTKELAQKIMEAHDKFRLEMHQLLCE